MRGGSSSGARVSSTTTTTATATSTGNATPAPRAETPAPAPDPNAQLISRVSDALRTIGWNPDDFNLQVGAIEIVFPGKPTYDYPVLWANLGGTRTPFYLQAAMQNPSMVAINISGMMGRPVMHLI
jgi:hypothetical protein